MRVALLAIVAALAAGGGAQARPRIVSLDQCADQYVLALAPRDEIVGLSKRALNADSYLRAEATIGRTLDYVVIRPRLQRLYEWSSVVLGAPGLRGLIDDGAPVYAWPVSERELFDRPLRRGRVWPRA